MRCIREAHYGSDSPIKPTAATEPYRIAFSFRLVKHLETGFTRARGGADRWKTSGQRISEFEEWLQQVRGWLRGVQEPDLVTTCEVLGTGCFLKKHTGLASWLRNKIVKLAGRREGRDGNAVAWFRVAASRRADVPI